MFASKSNGVIAASLVLAVFLWGGNNVGVNHLVNAWPPIWAGCTRFLPAGFLLLGLLRRTDYLLIQAYCVVGGGVVAFALWNNALRHRPTSQVFLSNNLIPISTMSWANLCLGEPISRTYWFAMLLIVTGVVLGQTDWQRVLGAPWLPQD